MSNMPDESEGSLAGPAKQGAWAAVASSFGKLLQSSDCGVSPEQSKSLREGNADSRNEINELVLGWLMEDLGITAEACHTDSIAVFKDLLALIASETSGLRRAETYDAEAVDHLLEWFLEDIGSVARSFDLDPVDVFEDAVKAIISDTPPADRTLKATASAGTAPEDRRM